MNTSHRLLPLLAFGFTLTLFAADGPAPASAPAAPRAPKPTLGSTIFKWDELAVKPSGVGERRDVTDNPTPTFATFECHVTTLNPGKASHPPHRHNQEELIFMKEGTADVFIEGQTRRAGPGSFFFYGSGDQHNLTNVGEGRATYWVINLVTALTPDPEKHHKEATVRSAVYEWEKMKPVPTPTGERRDVCNGVTATLDKFSLHISTLNPGEAPHAPHRHPDEEIIIVKEGTLDVTINGKTDRATAGSIILFASNDLHGMRNATDKTTTYYVIRAVSTVTPATPKAVTDAK
jgi:quercetin dioxygenase-like cupin family protein